MTSRPYSGVNCVLSCSQSGGSVMILRATSWLSTVVADHLRVERSEWKARGKRQKAFVQVQALCSHFRLASWYWLDGQKCLPSLQRENHLMRQHILDLRRVMRTCGGCNTNTTREMFLSTDAELLAASSSAKEALETATNQTGDTLLFIRCHCQCTVNSVLSTCIYHFAFVRLGPFWILFLWVCCREACCREPSTFWSEKS